MAKKKAEMKQKTEFKEDREIAKLTKIIKLFESMDAYQQDRIIDYLKSRYCDE